MSETNSGTSAWERLPLVNDEEVINLSQAKVYVLSDSSCLGRGGVIFGGLTVKAAKMRWSRVYAWKSHVMRDCPQRDLCQGE